MLVVSDALYPRFQKLIGASCRPRARHRLGRHRAHGPQAFEELIEPRDGRRRRPRRPCATTSRSGSTPRARPASPRARCTSTPTLKLTDDLYGGPLLDITENDVCYSVAKLFFAYGLGNALTFPMSAGACTVLLPDRPTPDGVAALLRKHPVTVFYAVPTFYAAFLASPAAPQRAETKLRCCVSAGEAMPRGCRQTLARPLRRRHSRRHRLDRDAAHLPVQPRRRGEVRHHWQADARLRCKLSTTTDSR